VVNGEVTWGCFNAPTVLGQIKARKLRALAAGLLAADHQAVRRHGGIENDQ